MTAQYTKIGNTVGWFDRITNTWLSEPALLISIPDFISSISYEDQDKLAAYFQAKPIVKEFLAAGKLTQANIHAMKARVDADFANAVIDEESKIKLQYKLDELLTRF